jgi:hypothetical protein
MRIVFALIVAPLLALVDQSTALAMVGWSCAHSATLAVHALHFVFLAATVAAAIVAFAQWRRTQSADTRVRNRFLAALATASALLSTLVIVAMWIPVWMISPCIA